MDGECGGIEYSCRVPVQCKPTKTPVFPAEIHFTALIFVYLAIHRFLKKTRQGSSRSVWLRVWDSRQFIRYVTLTTRQRIRGKYCLRRLHPTTLSRSWLKFCSDLHADTAASGKRLHTKGTNRY